MIAPVFGYKIMFTFDMPDGSKNGGICSHPDCLPRVFALVREMGGRNLVITDETTYAVTH